MFRKNKEIETIKVLNFKYSNVNDNVKGIYQNELNFDTTVPIDISLEWCPQPSCRNHEAQTGKRMR